MTVTRTRVRGLLVGVLVAVLIAGGVTVLRSTSDRPLPITAYFANSKGIYVGDDVLILGFRVGRVERIEPQPDRVRIDMAVDRKYKIPADVQAAVLSPTLVTARQIQLTPAYTSGPVIEDNAVIPLDRTVVPVEWDDVRTQLQRLSEALEPTEPGGASALGAMIDTAADNLRGQGQGIRDAIIKVSQAMTILGDHSADIFDTVRNLSVLVDALHASGDALEHINRSFSAATTLLANSPNEVGAAIEDFNRAVIDVGSFIADNRDTIGVASDKITALSTTLTESLDDIKQTLHIAPNTLANFNNIYSPATGSLTGAVALNNFANPITFICGGIQAASRLNAEHAAKLCVQYLAPIVKNRQYNFPPIGTTIGPALLPLVGTSARPNEITYSEEWMRPDHVPPAIDQSTVPPSVPAEGGLPAERAAVVDGEVTGEPTPSDTQAGLRGLMLPGPVAVG